MKTSHRALSLALAIYSIQGCGDLFGEKESDSEEQQTRSLPIDTKLNLLATSGYSQQTSFLRLAPSEGNTVSSCAASYKASDQASAAAESVKIKLRSIALGARDNGEQALLFQSTDANGTELALSNGVVDLSGLALETSLREGVYDRLVLVFKNAAAVTGCVTETWQSNEERSECTENDTSANCEPISEGEYTFCTQSAKSTFDIMNGGTVWSRANFALSPAQEMTVPLDVRGAMSGSSDGLNPDADYSFEVKIAPLTIGRGNVTPAEGEEGDGSSAEELEPQLVESSLELTLVADLNTFLRFEGNTRADLGPSGKVYGTHNIAFFYTSFLPDVMTAYVGAPGTIEGYYAEHCFDFRGEQAQISKAWLTFMFDETGAISTASISPYDDSGYIVMKGSFNPSGHPQKPSAIQPDGTINLVKPDTDASGQVTGHEELSGFKRLQVGETHTLPKENMTLLPRGGQPRDQATTEYKRIL